MRQMKPIRQNTSEDPCQNLKGMPLKTEERGSISAISSKTKYDYNNASMIIAAPLHDFDGKFIGVVALDKKMDEFYDSIQDAAGLGKTGETTYLQENGQ